MDSSTRQAQRQPAGIPAGGQYAPSARRRANIPLDDDYDYLSDAVPTDGLVSDREAAVLLDQARVSASFWAGRVGTNDPDEAASRALLAYLETRDRQSGTRKDAQAQTDATARTGKTPTNVRAYVHRVVMTQTILALGEWTGRPHTKASVSYWTLE